VSTSITAARDYRLFGLRLRSEIDLPELFPASGSGVPDISIRTGSIEGEPGAFGIASNGDALLLTVPEIARYRVWGGSDILVDPVGGVPARNVRLYLLGSAFGALLHQRGMLPLHANSVEIDGRAIAFMGASGAGKSTLAAWFHDHGHKVITDDICVIGFDDDGVPHVAPGLPRLRLWKEALEASGRETGDYDRAWDGSEEWDKFEVPLSPNLVADAERRLRAIYLLQSSDEFEIRRLRGSRAAQALIENTYRGRTIVAAAGPRLHWEACLRVAEQVPVFELRRPHDLSRLDQAIDVLVSHARDVSTDRGKASAN
jgi:hypothetical protein